MNNQIVPVENIQNRIFTIRNVQVMLDSHLAEMYQVETKVLNQAVKRNIERFPDSFRFRLTLEEYNNCMRLQTDTSVSRSQIVTLNAKITDTKTKRGQNLKYLPYAFTEQGVELKDLGKKWFAFSKINTGVGNMLNLLKIKSNG